MRRALDHLVSVFLRKGYLAEENLHYARNGLFDLLGVEGWPYVPPQDPQAANEEQTTQEALSILLAFARDTNKLPQGLAHEDDWTARITDLLIPDPRTVQERFTHLQETEGIAAALQWFYGMNVTDQYIKTQRIAQNKTWTHPTAFGDLQVTLNRSKPEKTPEEIKAAAKASSDYPACMLCEENVGLCGEGHAPRRHHRILRQSLAGEPWFFQYSPYAYFPEHCIVFSKTHRPMKITAHTLAVLLAFTDAMPDYFIASNADLPIVGGSILSHDHFQGGRTVFPVEHAQKEALFQEPDGRISLVNWPVTTLCLEGSRSFIEHYASKILGCWRGYSDPSQGVLAQTMDTPHNTVNFHVRKKGESYQVLILLRNNRTDAEHPSGIFHTRARHQVIKKENIGIIEALGLAIFPGRLMQQMEHFAEDPQFAAWHTSFPKQRLDDPQWLIGETFLEILQDVGVFALDESGRAALLTFLTPILLEAQKERTRS
ncbi:Galactose-1-phosphate uridylyltransferase [Clostridiaceae bacterium JG1575]|nr:Galactose-1-phosphate uridylyltransferase [Clostridiaceae bacterium JG1575]